MPLKVSGEENAQVPILGL